MSIRTTQLPCVACSLLAPAVDSALSWLEPLRRITQHHPGLLLHSAAALERLVVDRACSGAIRSVAEQQVGGGGIKLRPLLGTDGAADRQECHFLLTCGGSKVVAVSQSTVLVSGCWDTP